MRPRVYPPSNVGRRVATRGRNSRDQSAEPGEPAEHAGREELQVQVRALFERGQTLPSSFDSEAIEDFLRTGNIESDTAKVLGLWMAAHAPVRL